MNHLRGQHLHFDPTSGIAGDMTVAALVDLGVPEKVVTESIAAMGIRGLRVGFESRQRGAYRGKGFVVRAPGLGGDLRARVRKSKSAGAAPRVPGGASHGGDPHDGYLHDHGTQSRAGHNDGNHGDDHEPHDREPHDHAHQHRDYADIRVLLRRAKLDSDARALAEEVFARIAEVESTLHGTSLDRVTFHEVGAFDSIADVVGAAAAITWLAPASIGASPPVVGTGIVRTAHGPVPVPAPATAELLRGIPMLSEGVGELTTPTGAALLVCTAHSFGPPPPLTLSAIGYGAGTRELSDRANVLRVLLGRPFGQALAASADAAVLIQTNVDDMSGQLLADLMQALFAAGALDVWATPIFMKKGRPAHEVSALVEASQLSTVRTAFFINSTTLGIRLLPVSRTTLPRSVSTVETSYGAVGVKLAAWDGQPASAQPEFDDCQRLALAAGVPTKRVWIAAMAAANSLVMMPGPVVSATRAAAAPAAARPAPQSKRHDGRRGVRAQPSGAKSAPAKRPAAGGSGGGGGRGRGGQKTTTGGRKLSRP